MGDFREGLKKNGLDNHVYPIYTDCMGTMILRNVPDELRKRFKLLCIQKNTNMTETIIKYMEQEVEKAARKGS